MQTLRLCVHSLPALKQTFFIVGDRDGISLNLVTYLSGSTSSLSRLFHPFTSCLYKDPVVSYCDTTFINRTIYLVILRILADFYTCVGSPGIIEIG